jgi:hypothetical protein
MMKWAGHVVQMRETKNACRILVANPEGKRPLARPRHRWVNNIKMNHREVRWRGMDLNDLDQCRDEWRELLNTLMDFRIPENIGKFLSIYTAGGFSRRAQLHELSYIMCPHVGMENISVV